jgi:uncharacterized protein
LRVSDHSLEVREFRRAARQLLFWKRGEQVFNQLNTTWAIVAVAANGDFSTFSPELLSMTNLHYGDFILGNLASCTVDMNKADRMHRDIQSGILLCAQSCEYFGLCGGDAPSNKIFENGTFISSETLYCQLSRKALIDAALESLQFELSVL